MPRPRRAYYDGAERSATGDLKGDHHLHRPDATGLNYNARYYDPALGTFVSPDSMVPGAGQVTTTAMRAATIQVRPRQADRPASRDRQVGGRLVLE